MASAVPWLGKTFDHDASALAGEATWSIVSYRPWTWRMESLFVSAGVVALAEIGDKTQLLAFLLAAHFKRATPIVAGIFIATLLNHALAGALGAWITSSVEPGALRWALGVTFIAMGAWVLVPDRPDTEKRRWNRLGAFGTTLIAFFLAEMGDKTQIATVALAARDDHMLHVVAGTTIGMMMSNVPVVLAGGRLSDRIPVRGIRVVSAMSFFALGAMTIALRQS